MTDWDTKTLYSEFFWSPASVRITSQSNQSRTNSFIIAFKGHRILEKMFNSRVKIIFLLVLSSCFLSACAQVKEAGRTIGHTTRDVATAIGHGTRDAAKAVGEGVKKVVKSAPEDEW